MFRALRLVSVALVVIVLAACSQEDATISEPRLGIQEGDSGACFYFNVVGGESSLFDQVVVDRDLLATVGIVEFFFPGETLVISAGNPAIGEPTELSLFVDDTLVESAAFPGEIEYTFPSPVEEKIAFGVDQGQATWSVSCIPVSEPDVISVGVDIKPDGTPNSVNTTSRGVLPVAILTTADFDASTVDPTTVTLGDDDGNDTAAKTKRNGSLFASLEDVDGDGDMDLSLKFDIQALVENGDLAESTTELILNGETTDGTPIQGSDSVDVVP